MPRQTPDQIRERAARMLAGEVSAGTAADVPITPISPDPVHESTRVRAGDYETSEEGGRAVGYRAPNQRLQMLLEWQLASKAGEDGLTDEEAAERAGLLGSCSWKRAGELRAEGWIMWHPDGLKRKGHARVNRKVSVVTSDGLAALARRELA